MYYLYSENKSALTWQLICTFVLAYAKCRFSHDAAHIKLTLLSVVCDVGEYRIATQNTCALCPLNTYQNQRGTATSCINCLGQDITMSQGSDDPEDCVGMLVTKKIFESENREDAEKMLIKL